MGSALAKQLARAKHEVIVGSRDVEKARRMAKPLGKKCCGASYEEAVAQADVVVLAVPYAQAESVLMPLQGALNGKVVVDITNPLNADFSGLVVGHTSSAAEEIQKRVPNARVVKAFNHVFAPVLANAHKWKSKKPSVFICGNDLEAKQTVQKLVKDIGFVPVDAGPLQAARYIEPAAFLMVALAYGQKMGPKYALKLVK